MEFYKDKNEKHIEDEIDFELDLTSNTDIKYNKIQYTNIKKENIKKENTQKEKIKEENIEEDIGNILNKIIDIGFFLSGFFIVYIILKIKNICKKRIEDNQNKILYENIYKKKIYKKKNEPEL